ncbi:putative Nuclear cap-binding protein subunit 2 [Blattamonas nauphoetae]|uniref:Nuclear cap-binding protein subunit 2 n=1 Tax=Blattamonas nauphoetae TaxID=2049346 RepID=A0ABQ9X7X7_9EUKA|nr:putative Nuclear cap-binding protein subunit 2 [Blattamonas nauphoetae]
MSFLFRDTTVDTEYYDRKNPLSREEQHQKLETSSTVYIGNLSYYTREERISELFSKAGTIKRIIMGLDSIRKTPCGFCFVEYYDRDSAINAIRYINQTKLEDRTIRVDLDIGFTPDRQYGRGKSGRQVRDDQRQKFDPERGDTEREYREREKDGNFRSSNYRRDDHYRDYNRNRGYHRSYRDRN